jgi:type VI secretion system secreted protein Hcp
MFKDKGMVTVRILSVALFLSLVALTVPGIASAAEKIFLKIDGIQGESLDAQHKDWIDVLYWSIGVTSAVSARTVAGAVVGKASFQDLKFTKLIDKSSALLFRAVASGKHIKNATLEVWDAAGKFKFWEIVMEELIVSGITNSGNVQANTEEITLNFGTVKWTYTQPKRQDGSGGGQVKAGWNVQTNKEAL